MTTDDPSTTRPDDSRPPVEGAADDDAGNRARRVHPAGRSGVADEAFSFEPHKQRAADALEGLAESARSASRELRSHADRWAHSIDAVAHELQRWADGLRTMPVARLADDAAGYARRRPGVVLSGAALLALGVAVYLQASRERDEQEAWPAEYTRHA